MLELNNTIEMCVPIHPLNVFDSIVYLSNSYEILQLWLNKWENLLALLPYYILPNVSATHHFDSTALLCAVAMCSFMLLWIPDSRQVAVFFLIPGLWAVSDAIYVS